MPTDDQQILVAGVADAPADFIIPGNGQITPKAVNAIYDGTNAAGDFMPTLEIVSDAGVVVARVPASTVVAGNSAEVTWAPFLEAPVATPAPAASIAFASGSQTNGQAVNAGVDKNSSFASAFTSDATVFSWSTTVSANDTLTMHPVGTAIVFASAQWSGGTSLVTSAIYLPSIEELVAHNAWNSVQPVLPPATLGLPTHMDQSWVSSGSNDTVIHLNLNNQDGGNHSVFFAYLSAIYLTSAFIV